MRAELGSQTVVAAWFGTSLCFERLGFESLGFERLGFERLVRSISIGVVIFGYPGNAHRRLTALHPMPD